MKIKTRGNGEAHTGLGSTFICENFDIGDVVTGATINIGIDDIVTADCNIALTGLEIDGAVLKINEIEAPVELVDALRDYFKTETI